MLQSPSWTDLVEGGQEAGFLAGQAVALLDGGDGALHVAWHQQLRQLQQTVAKHKELQPGGEEDRKGEELDETSSSSSKPTWGSNTESSPLTCYTIQSIFVMTLLACYH